ncbi:20433_t:CDS:2 [Gigaspora rosea]|nr:20433_t:CDS:2 [Gigaspora rosea]
MTDWLALALATSQYYGYRSFQGSSFVEGSLFIEGSFIEGSFIESSFIEGSFIDSSSFLGDSSYCKENISSSCI